MAVPGAVLRLELSLCSDVVLNESQVVFFIQLHCEVGLSQVIQRGAAQCVKCVMRHTVGQTAGIIRTWYCTVQVRRKESTEICGRRCSVHFTK